MTHSNSKSDVELVRLSLENPDHFSDLVERYEKRLMRYVCRTINVNNSIAEDVLQEIFIKIYRNLNDFQQDLKFSSWAYRIAHNEAINHLKKYQRSLVTPLETDDETLSLIEVLKSEVDLPKDLNLKQIKLMVHNILFKLNFQYREVLYLHYIDDYNYREMSDILKKPMGTIATLVSRAKKQFKALAIETPFNF